MPLPRDPGGDDLTAEGKSISQQNNPAGQYGVGGVSPDLAPAPTKTTTTRTATAQPVSAKPRGTAPSSIKGVSAADWALVKTIAAQYKIDPYILVAIGIHETGWGTLGDGRNGNILGVGSYDSGSTYKYAGLRNQLEGAAKILQRNGVHTIADIAAGKLAPSNGKVRYASDPHWSAAVVNTYNSISGTKFTGTVSTATSGTGTPAPAGNEPDAATSINDYGFISAIANSEPELKNLMTEFAGQDLSNSSVASRLEAEIKDTQWYKTHTKGEREQEILKAQDPGEYQRKYTEAQQQMQSAAGSLGVALPPEALTRLTKHYLAEGWSGQQVNAFLIQFGHTAANGHGALQTTASTLKEQAAQYMVPISDASLGKWAQQIATGQVDPNSFSAYLKEQAKSMFPGLAAAIDRGVTVEQYADPYRQMAAQTLERDPQSIDFMHDPKFAKALFQQDPKTGDRTSMSLADWGSYLRATPEYAKTAQANDQATGFAEKILSTFGAVSF